MHRLNENERHAKSSRIMNSSYLTLQHQHQYQHHKKSCFSSSSNPLAHTAGDSAAGSPPAGAVHSTRTKATLSETRPDLASVGAASESAVSVENGVTGLDESRAARLECHALNNKLHGEVLSIGGNAVAESRAGGVVLAKLVDEVPQDYEKIELVRSLMSSALWHNIPSYSIDAQMVPMAWTLVMPLASV